MAESKREKGSAIVPFKGTKDTNKKSKWNPLVIILVEIIVLLVIAGLFIQIKKYANANDCGSEVWTYISNGGIELISAVIGLAAAKLSPIKEMKYIRSEWLHRLVSGIVSIGMFLIGGLSFLCLLTFFDIKGVVEKKSEELTQDGGVQVSSTQMSGNNEQESKEVKEIITYNIGQDLYMENRQLEDYYSGEITDENSKLVKAKILYNNLEYNKPKESVSDNYRQLLETADYYYESYKFKKKYADKMENDSEEWFEDRMDSLQESQNSRINAEKEGESPKNERPIATEFRDEGDEYFGRGNQNMAIDAYEQSADWFMIAIYHAAAIGDYEEMDTCMTKFKALGEEVQKLSNIDSGRRNKIMEWIEVYETFVGLVNEGR